MSVFVFKPCIWRNLIQIWYANRNSFGSLQNTIVIPELLEISEDLLKTVSSTLRQVMTQSSVLFLTRNRLFFGYLRRFGPRHCSLDNLRFPKVLGTRDTANKCCLNLWKEFNFWNCIIAIKIRPSNEKYWKTTEEFTCGFYHHVMTKRDTR